MTEIRRDIYGNAVDWVGTGRRRVDSQGRMRAEMQRGNARTWMFCRPHEDCGACSVPRDHDACPLSAREP
jgi:hypothetical protein